MRKTFKKLQAMAIAAAMAATMLFTTGTARAEGTSGNAETVWTGDERVTNLQCKPSIDGPILTWDAVQGADGYIIGGIQNGNPYKQIGYTAGTTYTDTASAYKGYCFYWVFPYKKVGEKVWAGKAPDHYVWGWHQLPAPTNLKVEPYQGALRVTWDEVPGSDGYMVIAKYDREPAEILYDRRHTHPGVNEFIDLPFYHKYPEPTLVFYWVYAGVDLEAKTMGNMLASNHMKGALAGYVYATMEAYKR